MRLPFRSGLVMLGVIKVNRVTFGQAIRLTGGLVIDKMT